MISSIFYNGDGSTRIFPVTFKINGEDYVRVYVDNVEVIDRTKYDIINNSIVFSSNNIPAVGTDNIKIYVATSASELGDLGAPLTDITNVANNLADIVAVSTQVIPNLPEILLADNNATIATNQATIATTKASEASASATSASGSAETATTKASEASASAISASNSATSASNSANTATTKANEASASASSALTSANSANTAETMAYKWSSYPVDTIVETDKYSAFHWATKAQQWATTVDTTNFVNRTTDQSISGVKTFSSSPIVPNATTATQAIAYGQAVKNTGDEAIAGVKTFSSNPIVPTPTEGNQAVNKDYVDKGAGVAFVANDTRVKTALNASDEAPIYACRAWVNFNGTGTVAIRASGNVSSIADNGAGNYTVNCAIAMPDANFVAVGMAGSGTVAAQIASPNDQGKTTNSQRFLFGDNNGNGIDRAFVNVAIFR